MQRQLALGCEINNHSWTHSDMSKMSKSDIIKEVKDTSDKIYNMVGVYPKFFRPPYISTSTKMYENIDLPFICGLGCNDWDVNVTAKERAETIINNVKDGEIILMHDLYGNDQTVEALDTIIPVLQKWGYKFVTVSQLFEKEGINSNQEYKIWTNVLE
jgi:peptidoglycan/xylan/chitin deacetylase (PgdA/CDA1 family)